MASTTASTSVPSPTIEDTTGPNISYSAERIIGNGSFGVVFEAKVIETNEVVAIKKVLQDKRFKNRELQIMRQLVKDPHSNIVALKHCFYAQVCFRLLDGPLELTAPVRISPTFFLSALYFFRERNQTNFI